MHTRHLDGNKKNCRLDNLRYGTASENVRDRIEHGIDNRGSRHVNAKLTEKQVTFIRRKHSMGVSCATLAVDFGVSRRLIALVVARDRWKHV